MPLGVAAQLPTASEVVASNESKHLYRTNLLRLQLDELSLNTSPVYEKLNKVEALVARVCEAAQSVKQTDIPADCAKMFPELSFTAVSLSPMIFQAPVSVEIIGSYKQRCLVKPFQGIDVVMVLPKSCLVEKEFKAHRYFDRRTAYCGELARQLAIKLPEVEIAVRTWKADPAKAVVVVSVPNSQWKINLIPCLPIGMFPESKLSADYKNLKDSTACDPLYNASILEDMHVAGDIFACPKIVHFGKAVQLAKVWLFRRQALLTDDNRCGLSGFHVRVLLSHICASQNLPREVSAYQLFKLLMSVLANTDWFKQVVVFGNSTATRLNSLPYPVVELPGTVYNPLWSVPIILMSELKVEAREALRVLDDATVVDPYELLFCPQSRESDFTVEIQGGIAQPRQTAEQLHAVLSRGLGKRLHAESLRIRFSAESIILSGDIDASTASALIDKGPSADSVEAKEFKLFWHSKAELRRFRDGSILECAVWQSGEVSVAEQVIRHLVGEKFPGLHACISVTPLGACLPPSSSHMQLWGALEELRLKLTAIQALPISIVDLRPSHARFTATDLLYHSLLQPLDCTVEFESSQAWPAGAAAIWHSKCAFLLAIREGLLKQSCWVEIAAEELSEEPFVDVRLGNFAFRLRIFANLELEILNRAIESATKPPTATEIAHVRQLWFSPSLRARIHALSIEVPAISFAITTAKEWMDNHLLLESWLQQGLHDWVECTVALVAVGNKAVQSPHVLFLNWLFFLANHSFKSTPLFLSWNEDLDDQTISLKSKFELAIEARQLWWLSSDIDSHCVFLRRPREWEATRIQALARKGLEHARNRDWDKIKFHTDNSVVFDILLTLEDERVAAGMDDFVKTLSDQFRKYLSFHYSKRHGIVGVLYEPAAFRPQSNQALKTASMLTVVGEVAVPDFAALTAKLGHLVKGSVKSVRIRK